MALPRAFSTCKIYQRVDDPKQTLCQFPGEPLPTGGAWRFIGSKRLDDWSQNRGRYVRPGARMDEIVSSAGETATPDHVSLMQRPELRQRPPHANLLTKQLYELKNRKELKPGELPPLPPRKDEEARTRLISPRQGFRIQEGPLTYWGSDAVPQGFHV